MLCCESASRKFCSSREPMRTLFAQHVPDGRDNCGSGPLLNSGQDGLRAPGVTDYRKRYCAFILQLIKFPRHALF